jgi:hypothetical protein
LAYHNCGKLDRTNKIGVGIVLIAIVAIITTASVSLPAVYAKKHHHLTDTQQEDSTASDAQGNPCNFGSHHDQCRDQFLESKEGGNILPAGPGKHFGECEDATAGAPQGSKCDVLNNDGSPNPGE